jgi:hypothetical protein
LNAEQSTFAAGRQGNLESVPPQSQDGSDEIPRLAAQGRIDSIKPRMNMDYAQAKDPFCEPGRPCLLVNSFAWLKSLSHPGPSLVKLSIARLDLSRLKGRLSGWVLNYAAY